MATTETKFEDNTKQHEKDGYLTKTANGAGWQINALDEYGEIFVEYAKTCKLPIADLGVAYGFTSKCLLDVGASVIANDLSEEMLQDLEKSVTDEQRKRLEVHSGDALDMSIKDGSLGGVWANRFLHFLPPDKIRESLKKYFDWLAPGGKLCITVASPYFASAASFLPTYEKRRAAGEEWPGFMTKDELPKEWKEASTSSGIDTGHVLDKDIMEREIKRAGFQIEKCSYFSRPYAETNGKEAVGVLAVKP